MWRTLSAVALAAAGLTLAIWNGAPLAAALVALAAGASAWALRPRTSEVAPLSEIPDTSEQGAGPSLPPAAEVLDAVDEPRLLVRARRVLLANRAARKMLGEHIEGQDVRLAIRHPAAAERLTDGAPDADARTRTELVGLGEPGRRWEMTTSRLGDGSRLVRLTDRSQFHAAEQMRVDFVANASHELRTPLATVLGFVETLQDDSVAEDRDVRRRFLKIMADEASRMRQLVEDLLSLSRVEADRFSAPRDPVDMIPLIEETRANLQQMIAGRESEIRLDNRASTATVTGDRPQLAQLLDNLLSNALKYGRAGAPVTVTLEDGGEDLLCLSVVDQGEGIAPEHLPRLTERFYRVDPGRSRSGGGTGLGLAIVKHIVGRHRGRLDIRSKPGDGTSVRVWLPKAVS